MTDKLIEDDFNNRPENDELAFLYYEKKFRVSLDKAIAELSDDDRHSSFLSYNHFKQTYINHILATINALDIPLLGRWTNNPQDANENANFSQIMFDIDAAVTMIKVRHAQYTRKASVGLDVSSRDKIRSLINKIKLTIDAMDIVVARRESLLDKLNAFATEVDRDRTRFEAFAALVIETTDTVAKVEKKLRPIKKWVDSIAGTLRSAKNSEDEQRRISGPQKHLPSPPKQIAPPSSELWTKDKPTKSDQDDEIPF